jgi:hypothetical protein
MDVLRVNEYDTDQIMFNNLNNYNLKYDAGKDLPSGWPLANNSPPLAKLFGKTLLLRIKDLPKTKLCFGLRPNQSPRVMVALPP